MQPIGSRIAIIFSFFVPAGPLVLSNHPKPTRHEAELTGESGDSASPSERNTGVVRPVASIAVASDQLAKLQQQINRLHRTVRLTIEAELVALAGHSFGTLAANQSVVLMVQEMLESHGLRVRCPECGHPAILRCSGRPGVAHGVFVLDHTIEGRRTFHGGTATVPELRLVAKPPRRSAKKAS